MQLSSGGVVLGSSSVLIPFHRDTAEGMAQALLSHPPLKPEGGKNGVLVGRVKGGVT